MNTILSVLLIATTISFGPNNDFTINEAHQMVQEYNHLLEESYNGNVPANLRGFVQRGQIAVEIMQIDEENRNLAIVRLMSEEPVLFKIVSQTNLDMLRNENGEDMILVYAGSSLILKNTATKNVSAFKIEGTTQKQFAKEAISVNSISIKRNNIVQINI